MDTFLVESISIESFYSAKFNKELPSYNEFMVRANSYQEAKEIVRQVLIRTSFKNIHHIESVTKVPLVDDELYKPNLDTSIPWWEANLVSCDVETTGLKASDSSIIELAFCEYDKSEKKFKPSKSYLLNENLTVLPEKITEITGITMEDLEGKPSFKEIYDEIYELFLNKPNTILIFHNRGFDIGFIRESIRRIGRESDYFPPSVCSMELAIQELDLKKNQLGIVAEHLKLDGENSHRAADDAALAGNVFLELCRRSTFFARKDCDVNQFLTYFDSKHNHI